MSSQAGRLSWRGLAPRSLQCMLEPYGWGAFRKDLFAGLTVGVVALPLAMAFAIASGVGPERGLFTAIVAGAAISLLSGSRYQVGGPTGAFVVVVFAVLQRHGYDGLVLATLLAGAILLVLAVSGLGALIKFIPYPVTTGFTAGIAVIIFSSQVKDLLGLPLAEAPAEFLPKWRAYAGVLGQANLSAAAIGGGSLAALIALRRYCPRLPGALAVVILSSVVVAWGHLPVETIGSRFGGIPRMLPAPSLPAMDLSRLHALLPDAITIAALAAIESLLSAVVADGMTGDRHNSNAELFGQGIANIASVLFGGIPATGAIARTATNIRAGAHGPLSGIIHAGTLLAFMLIAAPLAQSIPLAALAAILVMVAYNMSEWRAFRHLLRAPRSDQAVLLVTFGLTVLVDLNTAIEVGFIIAALLFMKRMIAVSEVGPMAWLDRDEMDPAGLARRLSMQDLEVFEIAGPFFFGVADRLRDALDQLERPPKAFILRMRHVPAIDATGLHALRMVYQRCRRSGTTLVLSGVRDQPRKALRRIGLEAAIGPENVCDNIEQALDRADAVLGADRKMR